MSYEVRLTEFSKKDFERLDHSQQQQILKSFARIGERGMEAGQPLRGKLSDCRKMKHKRLGLRVIFRESEADVEIIEIVVVGKRSDNEVYQLAEIRLSR